MAGAIFSAIREKPRSLGWQPSTVQSRAKGPSNRVAARKLGSSFWICWDMAFPSFHPGFLKSLCFIFRNGPENLRFYDSILSKKYKANG